MKRRHLLLVCVACALLGGCQTKKDVPPVLTVSAAECIATPVLDSSVPMTFDGKKKSTQSLEISASSSCLTDTQGRRRLFRLLRLPGGDIPYTVSVASLAHGYTVFAPHFMLLNARGETVREIDPQTLMFRSGSLTGIFRPRAGERYLLIVSNPDAVGKRFSRTVENMTATMVAAGGAFFHIYSGDDTTNSFVYSHAGEIVITVYPVPTS
ncbi:MAG: hypothetical protein HN403_04860 [Rhodospirillales bacterium]|jgi:hypothetical protein|nr:hypothetical protein [Rhodospirillales bacterium]